MNKKGKVTAVSSQTPAPGRLPETKSYARFSSDEAIVTYYDGYSHSMPIDELLETYSVISSDEQLELIRNNPQAEYYMSSITKL